MIPTPRHFCPPRLSDSFVSPRLLSPPFPPSLLPCHLLLSFTTTDFIGQAVHPVGKQIEEGINLLSIQPLKKASSNPNRLTGRYSAYKAPINIFKQRKVKGWFPMTGPSTEAREKGEEEAAATVKKAAARCVRLLIAFSRILLLALLLPVFCAASYALALFRSSSIFSRRECSHHVYRQGAFGD